ncbi:MAG: hypothetical protein WCK43_02410 [bacterium]
MIANRCKLVVFSLTVIFFQAKADVSTRLNDEGCSNMRQELSLAELRSQYQEVNIPQTKVKLRCDRGARCDGGFIWHPFAVSRQRAWVVYALPLKNLDKEWVSVSVYNICSKRLIMYGTFMNEEDSPHLYSNAAFASATLVDRSQAAYTGYEQLYMRLYQGQGRQRLSVVGELKNDTKLTIIDDFLVEAL